MRKIVVGIDGSDMSKNALRWAVEEARAHGAGLVGLVKLVARYRLHDEERNDGVRRIPMDAQAELVGITHLDRACTAARGNGILR